MSNQKPIRNAEKTIVVKRRKSHRMAILTIFTFFIIIMLIAMIDVIISSEFSPEINIFLLSMAVFPFLPLPLYCATWQITFDADGIQKRLFGIRQAKHPWTQVKEVRAAWLISERSNGISIIFKDKKAVRFRMDCEHAQQAKKLILSHCSIIEHDFPYL